MSNNMSCAALLLLAAAACVHAQSTITPQHCSSIANPLSKSLCSKYVQYSRADDKYRIAKDWSNKDYPSYQCAGITQACLVADMRRGKAGSTCTPAPRGTPCGDPGSMGICVMSNCEVPRPVSSLNLGRQQQQQQQQRQQPGAPVRFAQAALPFNLSSPPPPPQVFAPPPPVPPTGALTVSVDTAALTTFVPPSFLGMSREYGDEVFWDKNLEAFENIFDVLGPAPIIRIGGASQDALTQVPNATYVEGLVRLHCALGVRYIIGLPLFQNAPQLTLAVKNIFDVAFQRFPGAILTYQLGNEPNFWPTREGGFAPATFATQCTPVQYNDPSYQLVGVIAPVVGPADNAAGTTNAVRLEPGQGPNPDGTLGPPIVAGRKLKQQGKGSRRLKQTVTEIPNPANYALYRQYQRPYVPFYPAGTCFTQRTTRFTQGWAAYSAYFNFTANAITGCGGPQTAEQVAWGVPYWGPPGFNRRIISGPSWGNFNIGLQNLQEIINNGRQCFLREVNLHWYDSGPGTTIAELMDTSNLVANATLLTQFVGAARAAGLPLRITESNTVSNGGQGALSNTMAAALWTAEVAFEFAKAGASGVHFHWGNGGALDNNSPAYIGVQTFFKNNDTNQPFPQVRAPFYGYVLFSRAFGNNGPAIMLNSSSSAVAAGVCGQVIKTYSMLLPAAGLYSIAILNKGEQQACEITINLPGVTNNGTLQRLLSGPGGLANPAKGMTFAGQTYENSQDGRLRGPYTAETITGEFDGIQATSYVFFVPAASAAVLQIPLAYAAGSGNGRAPEDSELGGGPETLLPPEGIAFGGSGVTGVNRPAVRPTFNPVTDVPIPATTDGPVPIPPPAEVPEPAPEGATTEGQVPGPVPIPPPAEEPAPGPVPIPPPAEVPAPGPVPIPAPTAETPGPVPIPAPDATITPAPGLPTGPGDSPGAGASDTPALPPTTGPVPLQSVPDNSQESVSDGNGGRYLRTGTSPQGGPVYTWVSGRKLAQLQLDQLLPLPPVAPVPAPTNLGIVPNSTQVGPLTVGIPGQGGYTLQRPGSQTPPATAQECPGIAKLQAIQAAAVGQPAAATGVQQP